MTMQEGVLIVLALYLTVIFVIVKALNERERERRHKESMDILNRFRSTLEVLARNRD